MLACAGSAAQLQRVRSMQTLVEADFLRWAEGRGLAVDVNPQMAILEFHSASDNARFWCIPDQAQRRPHLFFRYSNWPALGTLASAGGTWVFGPVRTPLIRGDQRRYRA